MSGVLLIAVFANSLFMAGGEQIVPTASAFFDLAEDEYTEFLPGTSGETATQRVDDLIERASTILRLLIGSIAALMALIGVVRIVASQGKEEEYTKGKDTLVYGVAGLAAIALSADVANILSPQGGGLLGNPDIVRERELLFNNTTRIVITFVKYVAGSVAVFMLVRIGFRMVAVSEDDAELSQDKKNLWLITLGLAVLIFSDTLVRRIFYRVDSPLTANASIDLPQAIREFVSFTNLMVSLVAPIGVITLVAGGLMYALSGANEELADRAKKMIQVSLIGIILIYGAFGIVNTFILGRF